MLILINLFEGGTMVLSVPYVDESGQGAGMTKHVKKPLISQLNNIWRQMGEDGHITEVHFSHYSNQPATILV